jgi:hypothetical protein
MALWIPVFAALFGPVSDRAAGVHTVYYTFLRVRTHTDPCYVLTLLGICAFAADAVTENTALLQSANVTIILTSLISAVLLRSCWAARLCFGLRWC